MSASNSNVNFRSHLQNLTTITDFDFAVSDSPNEVNRVSAITANVTRSEVDLIIWLLLEKEFGINGVHKGEEKNELIKDDQQRQSQSVNNTDFTDAVPAVSGRGNRFQSDGHRHRSHSKSQNLTKREQALRYAEDLLAAVGVNIPFESLSPEQRGELFRLFCSSSNLLIREKFSSILDLYSALRRRSKFREEFYVMKSLGTGNFGTVYSVRKRQSLEPTYALKKVILTLDLVELIPMIINESRILKAVAGNENVVHFYDSWLAMEHNLDNDWEDELVNSNKDMNSSFGANTTKHSEAEVEFDEGSYVFYLLMEEYWISLREWRNQFANEELTSIQLRQICFALIDGLEWVHSKGYLHLDINPKNILWKNENKSSVVISDFGLAVVGPTFNERVGTTPYCAPEKIMSAKSDIYSFGVSLLEISQQFATRSEFFHKLEARDFATGSEFLDEILPAVLQNRPQQRPSATELKAKYF